MIYDETSGYYSDPARKFSTFAPAWAAAMGADLNALNAMRTKAYDLSTLVPALVDRCLTYPDNPANQAFAASIVGGKLRIGTSVGTDGNMRRGYGLVDSGVGSHEVRTRWDNVHMASGTWDASSPPRGQFGHVHDMISSTQVVDRGTATGGAAGTLTNSGGGWTTDQFIGVSGSPADGHECFVRIVAGTGTNQVRRIYHNTGTVLSVYPNWVTAPDATSRYRIEHVVTRGVSVMNSVFLARSWFQLNTWDGGAWDAAPGALDFSAYLRPGGTLKAFPWFLKTRRRGVVFDVAVWQGGDSEPAYGANVNQCGSMALPTQGYDFEPGLSGLYVGHVQAGEYVEFGAVSTVAL